MRASLLAIAAMSTFFALGADCGGFSTCQCTPCGSAIQLTVFDDQDQPINDTSWTVEATHDGSPVGDIGNCDPDFRVGNSCAFGFATGIYRVTVRAPGFQTREIAARFAAASGEDCCRCLAARIVTVKLEPEG